MKKIFKPATELTFNTVQHDRKHLLKCVQNSTIAHLYVDLSQVKLCDSAGLALLIEAKRLCNRYHKELIIEHMPKNIYALAEFCGVQEILVN